MEAIQYPIFGACQCGKVTYELLAPPTMVVACHCKECQKLSTSAFSITAMVEASNLVFKGEMQFWSRPADSGNRSDAMFCPSCGNRIYHVNPDEPDKIKLKPSNLSDTRLIQPTAHVWLSEKQAWFQVPDGVMQFDKQP
ncbi:GFA family protein [Shewanella salipaludis]|uniref:GFA family protein n=1 Tax=Shewanella salipaludis TaxID=2723052 RepID=UPI0031400B7D